MDNLLCSMHGIFKRCTLHRRQHDERQTLNAVYGCQTTPLGLSSSSPWPNTRAVQALWPRLKFYDRIQARVSGRAAIFLTVLLTVGVAPQAKGQPSQGRNPDKFTHFDSLTEPGLTTSLPPQIDTILGDKGGLRSWLAERDMGVQLSTITIVADDLTSSGQPRSPQRYNGQRATLQQQTVVLTSTFGLASLGLPNAKFILSGLGLRTSFRPNGPSTGTIRTFAYYQNFLNGAIEVKAGWITNYLEFVGLFTGGSLTSSNGLSALIPIQVGLSADPVPTPSLNVTVNAKNDMYAKLGLQRSTSPRGTAYEVNNNDFGLRFSQSDAGMLKIAEFGLRRMASTENRYAWIRAGAIYNASDYKRFIGQGTSDNKAAYVAADVQITQRSQTMPSRGLYLGASVFAAPSDVNVYTRTVELRAFDVGLFDSRPMDTAALRVVYNRFSDQARRASESAGLFANSSQLQVIASYSARLGPGAYIIPAITYSNHPSFIGDFNQALTASAVLFLSF